MKSKLYLSTILGSVCIFIIANAFSGKTSKADVFDLDIEKMKIIGEVDERYQSFNVEMCEVIGGDFWIPYHLLDSVRKNSDRTGIDALKWKIPPIDLYGEKIRMLASALGPAYIRVSGTWANAIYFQDSDEPELASPPEGYQNILTREQWKGVIDFCKAVNAKLVTSFSICDGMRDEKGNWTPVQVESLLNYTRSVGGRISAAALFNEPSHASHGDAPEGYNETNFAQDFAAFKNFVSQAAPDMKILGPGSTGEGGILPAGMSLSSEKMLSAEPKPEFDVFSYHYYGNVSRRCMGGQTPENALSESWLAKTEAGFKYYEGLRDKYSPGIPIWLTETAETACGGNPWAATYMDSFRYLVQLGRLAKKGVQVVMHNTLARSEYALLDHDTHNPRPNYWAALLWNRLMGPLVYDAGITGDEVDVFAHSLKNSSQGMAVLIINPHDYATSGIIPVPAEQYMLTSDMLQTKRIQLNGKELKLTANGQLPFIRGAEIKAGELQIPAHSITFLAFNTLITD